MAIAALDLKIGATMPWLVKPPFTPPTLHLGKRTGKGGIDTIVGQLTKEFLDFSASRGNNLRDIGLEPGCKWCLCTARWKEAMEAAKGSDDPVVPKYVSL